MTRLNFIIVIIVLLSFLKKLEYLIALEGMGIFEIVEKIIKIVYEMITTCVEISLDFNVFHSTVDIPQSIRTFIPLSLVII